MHSLVITLFGEFRFMGELIVAAYLLLLPSSERRPRFRLWACFGVCLCVAASFAFLPIDSVGASSASTRVTYFLYFLWYVFIIILTAAYLSRCFWINTTKLFWTISIAFCMQHLVYICNNELLFMNIGYRYFFERPVLYIGISLLTCAVIYTIIYRILRHHISRKEDLEFEDTKKTRAVMFNLAVLLVIQSLLSQQNTSADYGNINNVSLLSDLVNNVIFLTLAYSMLKNNGAVFREKLSQELNRSLSKQYDSFRASVDYLNIKIHDLKHEIRHLSAERLLTEETVAQLQEDVALYEAFARTGNYTLDTILTEKHIACLKKKIAFSHMAEGECLAFMREDEIYILFANMLDNAIEHVQSLDEEIRYIKLVIRPTGNMVLIHQENSLTGDLKLRGGLPVTSGENPRYHGFGIKSMQAIVHKYCGRMQFEAKDGVFSMEILLPGQDGT